MPSCNFLGAFRKDNLQKHMRKAHGMQSTKGQVVQNEVLIAYKLLLVKH
jgi:hypothetical protein